MHSDEWKLQTKCLPDEDFVSLFRFLFLPFAFAAISSLCRPSRSKIISVHFGQTLCPEINTEYNIIGMSDMRPSDPHYA